MKRVLTAVDASACSPAVLNTARAIGDLFGGARVDALHVRENGGDAAARAARDAGLELREMTGEPIETIAAAAGDADVVAVVLGARGGHAGPRPAGHTALELITRVGKPVVVVPPDARTAAIGRILTPLEGSDASSAAIAETLALAASRDLRIVVLHVHAPESVPPFEDQAHHEAPAWEREFAARFVSLPRTCVEIVERVGSAGDCVLAEAADGGADLIVLGWSQDLSPGHAAVVREALAHSTVPVLLVAAAADAAPDRPPRS